MLKFETLLFNVSTIDKLGHQHADQAIVIGDGRIAWCGAMVDLPPYYEQFSLIKKDCHGQLLTPGLIDCHTHLVYAGNRAHEFKQRLLGLSYAEIAKLGGGILSTVRQVRSVSEEVLLKQSLPRILALRAEGVTTVEIKSGYGLNLEDEVKMLRVAKRLGDISGLRVMTTFLGAHAVPDEFSGNRQAYVDTLCQHILPQIAELGLADAVDVFCESIGFSLAQTEQLFECAATFKLPVKCHAEQLSNLGATELAAKYNALSSDHLEYLNKSGIEAMASADMVAVLLPGAFYYLGETQKPPVQALRAAGVGMAIATDCNPGTSPTTSLRLMMNMACQYFDLSVAEVLSGVTYEAARALGIAHLTGSITTGLSADLILWSIQNSEELCYSFGYPLRHKTMISGKWIHE